jgi:2-iminobutanoate/2-iminopropanoate deaminase
MPASRKYEVRTEDAPEALGPYNQAVGLTGPRLLFISGQIGIDPRTAELAPGGIKAQTEQCIRNIEGILKAAGGDKTSIVKTTIYLGKIEDFPVMNEAYATAIGSPYPARSCIGGCRLPREALVEIEAIAVLED